MTTTADELRRVLRILAPYRSERLTPPPWPWRNAWPA